MAFDGAYRELDRRPDPVTGLWRVQVRYRQPGSRKTRRKTLKLSGETRRERRQQAAEWLAGQQRRYSSDGKGLTWAQAHDIWLEKVAVGFNASYRSNVAHTIADLESFAPNVSIADTSPRLLSDFMDFRRDRRRRDIEARGGVVRPTTGNSTANKARTHLLGILRSLRREGVLPAQPYDIELVPKRNYVQRSGKSLDFSEAIRYIVPLGSRPWVMWPVLWIMATGWRSTPTCELLEENIDLDAMTATQTMKRDKVRIEPLDDYLLSVVCGARRTKEELGVSSDYLFTTKTGTMWRNSSLLQAANRCWARAGLPRTKIHDLRTTFATEALKRFKPAQVQAALDHEKIISTEHYNDQRQMDIAEVGHAIRKTLFDCPQDASGRGTKRAPDEQVLRTEESKPTDGNAVKSREMVEIVCQALGRKLLIPKEKALELFES